MKKFAITIVLILSLFFVKAQESSGLTIFSKNGELFTVFLNSIEQNQSLSSNVKMQGMPASNYSMKIIFENTAYNSIQKNIFTKAGYETTYIIKNKKDGLKVLRWYSEIIIYDENNETGENGYSDESGGYNDNGNSEDVYEPDYSRRTGCSYSMAAADFQKAKATVLNTDFESDKLIVAKQIAASNCLTSRQVRHLAGAFDFEDTKIKFAIFAYTRTFDTENYFMVYDVFEFSASIQELTDYINSVNR